MKAIINIKADKDVKKKAFQTAHEMGLPLSTVMNAFLKQFVAEREVTFSVPLIPSRKLEKILIQTDKDIKIGRNLSPIFTDMRKMDRYLANL